MKKIIIPIFLIALLITSTLSAYVVGYVKGSETALRHNGVDQLVSIDLYSKLCKAEDTGKLRKALLVGIEAADDTLKKSANKHSFPSGYYSRYLALVRSGMGSDQWLQIAHKSREEALGNLGSP